MAVKVDNAVGQDPTTCSFDAVVFDSRNRVSLISFDEPIV